MSKERKERKMAVITDGKRSGYIKAEKKEKAEKAAPKKGGKK